MSGTSFFDSLGLSFADTTHQSSAIASPVIFGAMAFGRGTAGGNSSAANPTTNSSGGATAVTPMTSLGGGGGATPGAEPTGFDFISAALPLATPFIEQTMGLNGAQVQDPAAKLALYGKLPAGVNASQLQTSDGAKVVSEGFAPSPLAIGGIVLVLAVGAFFLLRK